MPSAYIPKNKPKKRPFQFTLAFSPQDDPDVQKVVRKLNSLTHDKSDYLVNAVTFYMENGEPEDPKTKIIMQPSENADQTKDDPEDKQDDEVEMIDIAQSLAKFNLF